MSESLNNKQLDELAAPCWSYDHHSFDHVNFAQSVLHAAHTQPAPQGVAEVMRLVQDYADCDTSGLDNMRRALRHEKIEHAITAIVQERDELRNKLTNLCLSGVK